jgi:hypothetical protein
LDGWAIVAENMIEEAIRQGVFDDLPGKGQPLDLSCDPFESPLAPTIRRILRDNEIADLRGGGLKSPAD